MLKASHESKIEDAPVFNYLFSHTHYYILQSSENIEEISIKENENIKQILLIAPFSTTLDMHIHFKTKYSFI